MKTGRAGRGGFLASCALLMGCGGADSSGPTTSHQMAGNWSYETRNLQDGHSATCTTSGTQLRLTQRGVNFNGSALFGAMSCTWPGGGGSASLGSGNVSAGAISGDSVSFTFDAGSWRSVGTFVTVDSMAGIANLIYVVHGSQLILTGYWSARRQP